VLNCGGWKSGLVTLPLLSLRKSVVRDGDYKAKWVAGHISVPKFVAQPFVGEWFGLKATVDSPTGWIARYRPTSRSDLDSMRYLRKLNPRGNYEGVYLGRVAIRGVRTAVCGSGPTIDIIRGMESQQPGRLKTADRPHFWTITLSIVAILVSVISSAVALYSAHLATLNYHMQNRAWVFVKDANWEPYWFRITLVNRGKTPANKVQPTCTELDEYNPVSGKTSHQMGPFPLRFGPIPPDQAKDLTVGIPHEADKTWGRRTTVRCHVEYVDVFREQHSVDFCYVLMHSGDVNVGECVEGNESD
jgi:hypothetical protein